MRDYCKNCHYPLKTCVCSAIAPINNTISIIVLQHPNETHHAKNTVRLLKLSLQDISIHIGTTFDQHSVLRQSLKPAERHTLAIYPNANSKEFVSTYSDNVEDIKTLLFIDGSWRQAYAIWQANPWLQKIPSAHFAGGYQSLYKSRKAPSDNSLSTLEAVAFSLESLTTLDCSPLYRMLKAQQQHWFRHQPY